MFHPRVTSPAAQRSVLGNLDRVLSAADRAACEYVLWAEGNGAAELEGALRLCGRGKTPGADGLTYELPASMLLGIIVLVYKGAKAGPRTQSRCYRPLTMLNCDYKILAKAMACRFSRPLCSVIDATQTAFLPGRWVGDNVLQHLEEVDHLEAIRCPGAIAFVDFEKAYDATSKPWVLDCMRRMGFGPLAVRWVRLLLHGTRACCRINGFHTREFAVLSGLAQGSPLSFALYLIAA